MTDIPPPPSSSGDTTYFGIPNDYKSPTRDERFPGSVATPRPRGYNPNQMPGSVATPLPQGYELQPKKYGQSDLANYFVGMSAGQIADLQQQLMKAGLLTGRFQIGVADPTTKAAMKEAMTYANQQGLDAQTAVTDLANAPTYDPSKAGKGDLLQYELPDRETVKSTFGQTSRNVLGRALSEDQLEAMATSYEAELRRIQEQNFQQAAVEGATLYQAPDQEAFAAQQIRAQNPEEARAHDYSNAYNQFSSMISSSANEAKSGL